MAQAVEVLPRILAGGFPQKLAPDSPAPICASPITNGYLLYVDLHRPTGPNKLVIKNGGAGNAIIKVMDASTGRLAVAFFVESGNSVTYDALPDGVYHIHYAIGDGDLAESCRSFIKTRWADQFPGDKDFFSTREYNAVRYQERSFTLYDVPFGNIQPQAMSIEQFNAE
jgi:hypothetical protein